MNNNFKKNKIRYLYLNPNNLIYHTFSKSLLEMNYVENNKIYAFLIKIKTVSKRYSMAGNQGIWNSNNLKTEDIKDLYEQIKSKLNKYVEEYSDDEIDLIQIMFVELNVLPELKVQNINNINLNKKIIKIGETKKNFNNQNIPLTMDLNYFGQKLNYKINSRGYIDYIDLKGENIFEKIVCDKDNSKFKGGSLIISNKLTDNSNVKIFLYSRKIKLKYAEQLYAKNSTRLREKLLIVDDSNVNKRIIEVFDVDSIVSSDRYGKPKNIVYDVPLNEKKSEFLRTINDFTLHIKDDHVIKFEQKIVLPIIKYIDPSLNKQTRNSNIGTLDIETYYDKEKDKSFVYALGFKIFNGETKLFYKKPDQSSDDLIIECINSLLVNKYDNYIFYVHNLHGYDSIFILKVLLDFNSKNNDFYKINTVFRDNRIIKLKISIKKIGNDSIGTESSGTVRKITLLDSFLMLPSSLEKLAIEFKTEITKGIFPYEFVNKSNLYYIGNTPDKKFFKISENEYNSIKTTDWNLKNETLKYLEKDLESLMEVVNKFSKYIYNKYHIQITDCLTISKLAINILYNKYLKNKKIHEDNTTREIPEENKVLPLITNEAIYNFLKQGYYGGITEIYRPYGENLNYYDINSMYPFVAKNKMPGNISTFIELGESEIKKGKSLDLDSLFGFFFCRVKTNKDYLGILPIHFDNKLIFPHGEFEGVWFSEELKFAKAQGYEIQVIKGYNFNSVDNIFNNFVDDLYEIRLRETGLVKAITKLLLNSAFGRFGMSIIKPETKIVNVDGLEKLLTTHKVLDTIKINNSYIVTYESNISREVIDKLGLDLAKVLNFNNIQDLETNKNFGYVSVSTAAAITSYARVYINKIKLMILKNEGKIFYSDTDSIVTDMELPSYLVGPELGKLKLEYIVKKGYFISGKTYMLVLEDDTNIKKAKGVNSSSLSTEDFINMYHGKIDINVSKLHTKLDFCEGTVNIFNKKVILKHNSYTKREKLFDRDGLWIDTKPIIFNNLTESHKVINFTRDNGAILEFKLEPKYYPFFIV